MNYEVEQAIAVIETWTQTPDHPVAVLLAAYRELQEAKSRPPARMSTDAEAEAYRAGYTKAFEDADASIKLATSCAPLAPVVVQSLPPAARLITAQDVADSEPAGQRFDVYYSKFADALNAILGERGGGSEPCQLCGGTGRREKREYADTEMPYWNGQVVEVVALAIRRAIEEAELNPAAERDGRDRRLETAAALDALDEEIANG